ncbi:MAG: ABC transporter permease [Acidobacteria bacterium]|nr:ABC transporter permease [Acidobacteriota bacterium]
MFVLRMVWRETRASWRRLLFFFICIAVGVAAIVALRSVIQSVRAVFGTEAKSLIAADVLISTNRAWTPEARATIDRRLREFGAIQSTESVETPTMIRPAEEGRTVARMSELRAVQPGFPLYGTLTLQGGQAYSHALLKNRGVLVRPELLTALDVKVGDAIMIGKVPFTIRGVIQDEPGRRVGDFSLGPRVLIDYADLPDTGLLTFGSRARNVILVKLADAQVDPLVTTLRGDFKEEFVSARSYRAQDDEIGRDFDRAENYLSMVGLIIVILGGIAVSSVTRVFVLQKMHSIAVLKCTGATSGQIMAIYMLQVMVLGLAGSLLGVGLARAAVAAIPYYVNTSTSATATSLLSEVHYGVTWSAALQGIGIGVLVSLLFSVVPLLRVRMVKPSLLLRDESASAAGTDWVRIGAFVAVSAGLVAVTAWQAASLKVGLVVCAGFSVLALVLMLAGRLLVQFVSPLANAPSFPLRHAVLHLSRPGNQTRVILLAVGLGAFFIVGVRALQSSLLEEFSTEMAADAPDMFLMDVQRGQTDDLSAFLKDPAHGAGQFRLIPVLRARVTGVAGRETTLESFEDVRARGSLAREYTVTYRPTLESNEKVIAGRFWDSPSAEPEVSIEQGINERFQINVGDTVRFDILGRRIEAKVTSIRRVDWKDSRNGGFMFVFRPGVLDNAPQTFISPLRGPVGTTARATFQADLVRRFPNVSVIDFHEILATIQDVMSKVTLAISVVGGLVLFSGALILVGAVAMTKFQRVYEAAVFKTLGANTRTIARMLLFEYGVLGLLSGAVGSLGAIALSWGVSRYALDIPWRLFWVEHVGGVVATACLVAAIGVLSSLDVLRNKPLLTLRAE